MLVRVKHLKEIKNARPLTHELGGIFTIGKHHIVNDVQFSRGNVCRDAHGNLLSHVKNCSVTHKDGKYVFHTHPKSNRPSSGDLYNAIKGFPARKKNFIFSPTGIWCYEATKQLSQKIRKMTSDELRIQIKSWRFMGHMYQHDTQHNNCDEFIRFLHAEGFKCSFLPYSALERKSDDHILHF